MEKQSIEAREEEIKDGIEDEDMSMRSRPAKEVIAEGARRERAEDERPLRTAQSGGLTAPVRKLWKKSEDVELKGVEDIGAISIEEDIEHGSEDGKAMR
ncbi:MAG: hypothetical protein AAGJ80_05360 [Cyanobacteria bacterium J06553_1]